MIRYFKGEPNAHVIQFKDGEIARHGQGLQFWYVPMLSSIAVVPTASQDCQFIFNEVTRNFQEIAIQGALSYRLTAPVDVAKLLNFTVEPKNRSYKSEDPELLVQRIINTVQATTRSRVNAMPLEEALTTVRSIASAVLDEVCKDPGLTSLGVIVEGLYFTAVKATPEMQKALETEYRERLRQEADQAVYARRAAAVEEEKKIRESELNTEVELEYRRKDLVDTQARNQLALAEADAKAEELRLTPYGEMPPQALVGLALKEWAGKAGKIGNLSITPDLLTGVLSWLNGAPNPARPKGQ